MKFTKAFALGLTGAALGIATMLAAPVKSEVVCRSGDGWKACATTSRMYDTVVFNYVGGSETLEIRCNSEGMAFQSKGTMTQADAEQFAKAYCNGRGYDAHY